MTKDVFVAVEHLTVEAAVDFGPVQLLSLDDPRLRNDRPWFDARGAGCFAAIRLRNAAFDMLRDQARVAVVHFLRVLRVALRERYGVIDQQLRFRVGDAFYVDDGSAQFQHPPDIAYGIDITQQITDELRASQMILAMPMQPRNDIERKVHLALGWMERAVMTGEPLVRLLFLFFALEALLGEKSEGLKGAKLAFRQMMLSVVVTKGFSHPNATFLLYDEVRSDAVHGNEARVPTPDEIGTFTRLVWATLTQYLMVANSKGITKRKQMRQFLDNHKDRPKLIEWVRDHGGPKWEKFLERPAS